MSHLVAALIMVSAILAAPARAADHFIVQCAYSHSAQDDPIVFPGQPGASHGHDFVANTSTNAYSTVASLLAASTTCGTAADTAAYWVPWLWIGATRYRPLYARIYYSRSAPSGATVVAPPRGARMIAGDKTRATASPGVVSFSCGAHTPGDTPGSGQPPYDCTPYLGGDDSRDGLVGRVIFPHCWDGAGTAPSDFTGYAATCPAGWRYIPRLRVSYHYFALHATPAATTFGTTPGEMPWQGLHADFFNAWDQAALVDEISRCLNHQPNTCPTFFGRKVGDPGTPYG